MARFLEKTALWLWGAFKFTKKRNNSKPVVPLLFKTTIGACCLNVPDQI